MPGEVVKDEQLLETEEPQTQSDCTALALITRDSAPIIPPLETDEEVMEEPIVRTIKKSTPGNPNADEEISEFMKAMKLLSAASYSLSDLQRAQRSSYLSTPEAVLRPDSEKFPREGPGKPKR